MSRVPRMPTSQTQLGLFTLRSNVPRWSNLPRVTRQTIKTHLAALIRQHVTPP